MVRDTLNRLHPKNCEHAKPGKWLNDGGGLYLRSELTGNMYWLFRYTRPNAKSLPPAKRRNFTSLGRYPNPVSLADARKERDRLRKLLNQNIDPVPHKQEQTAKNAIALDNSLQSVAETWFTKRNWSDGHLAEWKRTMQRHVFDQRVERKPLGQWPISEIKIRHIMEVLQRMEDAGLVESLHRCRQKLSHIFNRAIVLELRTDNPVLPLTKEFKPRRRNVPGLIALPWQLVGQFQHDIDKSNASDLTKLAMQFMLLTVQRHGEMRKARWEEIDWQRRIWTIPAQRMKGNPNAREDHIVPLSNQALAV
ncbi:MAG: integrase arm-type DNA-binding domain-containing protein, partial [Pseudomonadota bacterium]|nr:integrase arm-type DNA-binding domain-containing protein [Pseudomonadota bacterium]